ncbi:MAG: GHKL domain-containing protein [Lachnospiraceae bacterium]|jgi:anti-sigma regulatory factor (Ser/Thr protein kinase)|nr:GHKL domain-containing protein [Lachnospiraceae bacterium]GFI15762.1 signal transduction histidine-protein kinase AtoS [Lachnospiraceae bacterium]
MLILLLGAFMVASGYVLLRKRSIESFFLSGMCISLMLEFTGILIFAAKKGGYSRQILEFLFVSMELKTKIQYLVIPLDLIGYMIALGRYLFPFFLLQMAMRYSMISFIRQDPLIKKISAILPVLSLILYYPEIYKAVIAWKPEVQDFIVNFSYFWIWLYILTAILLLVIEYLSITMVFFRRQFSLIVIYMITMSGLYLFYCGQDPGQVYRFYSSSYKWKRGIGYLQYIWDIKAYYLLILINVICGILGFISLLRYTQENYASDMEDVVMERKYNTARVGTLVFVHSTKNQLLANRVIFKRINSLDMTQPEGTRKMREYVETLENINEALLERMEELYRSVKSSSIVMVSCSLEEIAGNALNRFYDKCPNAFVEVSLESNAAVLADKAHLCEAIYNLLVNAQDAVEAAERGAEGKISLLSHDERLYTVIEIKDNGVGIPKGLVKKIFDPFYTSKNRNHNWGMGLYYVRAIVKGHLGSLRVESREGRGSSFYILLPKYER